MLSTAPILILQYEFYIANQVAALAFYFLIIGVIWKVIQYWMSRLEYENEASNNRVETQR